MNTVEVMSRRETIDEALRRRAAALGLFDRMDDAGEGRLRRRRADPAFDAAGLVDGAREHRIAGQFVDRQAFAGDRRLVHTGLAREHHRIERDAFARAHPHRRADGDLADRQGLPSAVRLAHLGTVGREREQAADRIARAEIGRAHV